MSGMRQEEKGKKILGVHLFCHLPDDALGQEKTGKIEKGRGEMSDKYRYEKLLGEQHARIMILEAEIKFIKQRIYKLEAQGNEQPK